MKIDAIVLSDKAVDLKDTTDRRNDEQYYAAFPPASGLPTMRRHGFFNQQLAHEINPIVLSDKAVALEDNNDRSDDERYYSEFPLAPRQG